MWDWLGVHVKKLDLVSLYQLHPMQLLDQDRLKHKGHFQPPHSVVLPDRLVLYAGVVNRYNRLSFSNRYNQYLLNLIGNQDQKSVNYRLIDRV